MAILLSLQIVRLRLALRRSERIEQRAIDKWRPVLHAAIVGEQPELPRMQDRERLPFLKLWVHLQRSLRGDARDALNAVARNLALDAPSRRLLDSGKRAERLLAALTLGYLRDQQAWPQLLALSALPDRTLALTASWALIRIDPQAAAERIMPQFLDSEDWALPHVAGMLQEAAAPAGEALARLLPGLPEAQLPRALRMAEALRMQVPSSVLARALGSGDIGLLVAALRSVTMPDAIDAVHHLLGHAHWQVRVQAARALGRIGEPGDIERLAQLLADPEWWVRYRAAQSLVELANLYGEPLDGVRAQLSDRFASDMLAQVMAEKGQA
jgi:HEAT repeat protein